MAKQFTDDDNVKTRAELAPEERDEAPSEESAEEGASESQANVEAQLTEKEKELAALKEQYLRTLAESDNIRKRLRAQSEETIRLQREGFLRDLLPIVDNLERAVEAASGGGNGKSIVEGVELVLRSLLDFLKSHGVTPLDSTGQPFDPQRHEAVAQIKSNAHPPNTVIDEFHRGYLIGDRMLRPARVSVAAREKAADNGEGEDGSTGS
jgi:molecular chaperone GrpE